MHVRIQNQTGPQPLKWDKTWTVLEVRQFDQYVIKVDGSDRVTIRNRKFLRKYTPVQTSPLKMTFDLDLRFTAEAGLISSPRPNTGMNTQPSKFKQTDSSISPSSTLKRSWPTTNAPYTTDKETIPIQTPLVQPTPRPKEIVSANTPPTTNFNIKQHRLSVNSTTPSNEQTSVTKARSPPKTFNRYASQ